MENRESKAKFCKTEILIMKIDFSSNLFLRTAWQLIETPGTWQEHILNGIVSDSVTTVTSRKELTLAL